MTHKKKLRIPTPIIDLVLISAPYIMGFIELKLTGDSLILNSIDRLSFGEKFILSISTFLLVEMVDYKVSYSDFVEKTHAELERISAEVKFVINRQESTQKKIELISHGNEVDQAIEEVKHPYFVALVHKRLKNMLAKNNVFTQTEYTNPSHANTFGAKGIKSTRLNLKCVSFMPEYWEDKKDTEYMDTQAELLKRGIVIQRLFIVNDKNRKVTFEQMRIQAGMGIETKYIEQSMVEEDFREKDFLIQDDELLVDLYFEDDQIDGKHSDAKELITMDEILLLERKDEFLTNWACAKGL
jgi:hypothetical protein